MLVTHTFDLALAVRGRRRELKLRQIEVAQAAQVGREWLVDFEHGKPTLELGKVLRTLTTLGIDVDIVMRPPARLVAPAHGCRPRPPTAPRRTAPEIAAENAPQGRNPASRLVASGGVEG